MPGEGPSWEALAEAARLERARVYGTTCPETHSKARTITRGEQDATAGRPLESFYGPASAGELQQIIDALSPVHPVPDRHAPAVRDIEQRIARGWNDTRIAEVLRVDVQRVADVRAAMDRAAS